MGYHLRYQRSAWAMHHVVSHCINGYDFLKPTPEISQICDGVLARALAMYADRIRLNNVHFACDHFQLLIESEDVHSLSAFMQYLKSNLSRELARVHDWQGPMWRGRYSSEEILDQESLDEVFKHMMGHPVREALVDNPRSWPGSRGFHQLIDRVKVFGAWVDRTAFFRAKRHSKTRDDIKVEDCVISYEVKLEKPLMLSHLSDQEYQERCIKLCNEAIKSARVKRSGPPIGMARAVSQPVLRTKRPKRSKRNLCRAKTAELIEAYLAQYRAFKRAYQAAYQRARDQVIAGKRAIEMSFPNGGITPLSMIGVSKLPEPPQLE